MKLLKPAWVVHKDGQPIFSIDIHPDGSRFATGGLGDDTGKIIIWNMAPVREQEVEKDETVPKILCEMDNHLGCVNCVRWSANGRYLASGGDDKLVMIWQISKYGVGSTVFGSDSKIVESWRPAHTLRGHAGDVLDLAWSPGDLWLATCSIDNNVIVWNAENFPEQVTVLKGHTGLVKGVTWDPVGKYLASQSDDKTLRVWRTYDWQQESIVTEPFKECGGTTHVLRCHWSPDGHYIVSAHAMNNSGPTAQIIERDGWKTSLDFVGHRKAITVVRFNPGILTKKVKKDSSKSQQYTCCAIGSRDRSLSIWLTALKRPLVVTHDLFTNSILDITWAQNGSELMCCSHDGTVAYLSFKSGEIGKPLPNDDVNLLLEKIYGKVLTQKSSSSANTHIIESADILKLQQQQQQQQHHNGALHQSPDSKSRSSVSSMTTPNKTLYKGMDISNSPFKPTDKQIETKTADGRRRITPIYISPQQDNTEAPVPYSHTINFATSKVGSSIQVEKQDKITYSGFTSPPTKGPGSPQGKTSPESTPVSSASKSSPSANKQIDSVVQPLAALDSHQDKTETSSKLTDTPKVGDSSKTHADKTIEKSKSQTLTIKRKHEKDKEDQPKKRGRPRLMDKERTGKPTPTSTPVLPTTANEKEVVRYVQSSSEPSLPVPIQQHTFNKQILGSTPETSLTLEVENNAQSGHMALHKLRCVKGGNLEWEQVLGSPILAVAGSRHIVCVACQDCSLSMFNASGQKSFPNIQLPSKISVLDVQRHHVMAISSKGSIHVWNMQKKIIVIKNEQLSTIMKAGDQMREARLTEAGLPVITLASSKSYTYSSEMGCWLKLYDRSDHVLQCSAHQNSKPTTGKKSSGTLASLQAAQDRSSSMPQRTFQAGQNLRQLSTINHLESQVQASVLLKSAPEYKFWLQTYIRYLVHEGLECRLREVCSDLLGPMYTSKSSTWDKTILGFNKRDLLKEMLPYFGENLKALQRLYTEFQEQLDAIGSEESVT